MRLCYTLLGLFVTGGFRSLSAFSSHSLNGRYNADSVYSSELWAQSMGDSSSPWNGSNKTSRRNFLIQSKLIASSATATAFLASKYISNSNLASPSSVTATPVLSSIPDVLEWIQENCDRRFLHAVVASDYRFLYRGVPDTTVSVRRETPDLLLPSTYSDDKALEFFQQLENQVLQKEPVKPSNGHLATTSIQDASQWGVTAASIWPVHSAHYAWFSEGGLFYPSRASSLDRSQIIVDGKDCGNDSLEDALRGDSWEIMVATEAFLTVPAAMDQELRQGLQRSFLL